MAEVKTTDEKDEVIASTNTSIDVLRGRIDHLKVQLDLGKLDVRDEVMKQLTIAQNACLAIDARLQEARHDLAVTAGALREGVDKLVDDVKKAIEAAESAIARG